MDESLGLGLLLHRLAIVHLLLLLLHMRSIVQAIRLLDSLLWLLRQLVLRMPQPSRCSSIATKGSESTGREAKVRAGETLLQRLGA